MDLFEVPQRMAIRERAVAMLPLIDPANGSSKLTRHRHPRFQFEPLPGRARPRADPGGPSPKELGLAIRPNSVSGYEKVLSDLGTPFVSAETGRRLVHVPWNSIRRLEYAEPDPWIRIEFGTASRSESVEAILDDGAQRSEVFEAALDRLGSSWSRRREQRRLGSVLGVLAIAGFVATFAWILYGQAEVVGNGLPRGPRTGDPGPSPGWHGNWGRRESCSVPTCYSARVPTISTWPSCG